MTYLLVTLWVCAVIFIAAAIASSVEDLADGYMQS